MSEDNTVTQEKEDTETKEKEASSQEQIGTKDNKFFGKDIQIDISRKKVDILLKATGDAPIMKNKRWSVPCDRTVGYIINFMKSYLKLHETDSLYLYVNQCFAPPPDQIIMNLYECFGSDGKLVLHYCKTPAWG